MYLVDHFDYAKNITKKKKDWNHNIVVYPVLYTSIIMVKIYWDREVKNTLIFDNNNLTVVLTLCIVNGPKTKRNLILRIDISYSFF